MEIANTMLSSELQVFLNYVYEYTALSFKNVLFSRKACYFIGGVMSE